MLATLASCSPVYVPAPPSAPLLSSVGEIAISVNFSSGIQSNASLAVMPIAGFSAFVEASLHPGEDVAKDELEFSAANAAIGYNAPIGDLGRIDLYVGGGLGNSERLGSSELLWSDPIRLRRTRFTDAFFQFDIGYIAPYIESAYQLRASYVMFDRFQTSRIERGLSGSVISLNVNDEPRNDLFLEHSYILRYGPPNVKLLSFITISHRVTGKDEEILQVPVSLGIGLQLRFDVLGEDATETPVK